MTNPALRPSGNPLLDDALEDQYLEDLERGNLGRKRRHPEVIPYPVRQWVSLGYWAHIDRQTCRCCGSITPVLVGVFHREYDKTNPSSVRSTRLSPRAFRDLGIIPSQELISVWVEVCAHCISLSPSGA